MKRTVTFLAIFAAMVCAASLAADTIHDQGTEIKGTVTAGSENGQIDLIKWTYVPRIRGY